MNFRNFERRYVFTGTLVLKTGLHVGSGWTVGSPSDDPVIRTPDGRPFIPGSSFKGAFRSTVEKLAPVAGLTTCLLDHSDPDVECLSPQKSQLGEAFRALREHENHKLPKTDEEIVSALEILGHPDWAGRKLSGDDLMTLLGEHLCDTCKLFGSPYAASRITFSDLLPDEEDKHADKMIQVRDGVAIDRDSEKAVDKHKYDYEVVAPAQTFEVEILLEDPTETDLGLTCMGLSEFVGGLGYIGGNRSRGLGNCRIDDLQVYELDLTGDVSERAQHLKKYLLGKTTEKKMDQVSDPQDFLERKITALLDKVGGA
jgi:CRISPR-associated RAMP protein (TIGR02581 family)